MVTISYKDLERLIKQNGKLVSGMGKYSEYLINPAHLANEILKTFKSPQGLSVKTNPKIKSILRKTIPDLSCFEEVKGGYKLRDSYAVGLIEAIKKELE